MKAIMPPTTTRHTPSLCEPAGYFCILSYWRRGTHAVCKLWESDAIMGLVPLQSAVLLVVLGAHPYNDTSDTPTDE